MSTKLTANFNREEFDCRDGTIVPVPYLAYVKELAEQLQVMRKFFRSVITITSGYRTPEYNKSVGGSPGSAHMFAKAADFTVKGWAPADVHRCVEGLIALGLVKNGGLGLYDGWIHYDVSEPRRWHG